MFQRKHLQMQKFLYFEGFFKLIYSVQKTFFFNVILNFNNKTGELLKAKKNAFTFLFVLWQIFDVYISICIISLYVKIKNESFSCKLESSKYRLIKCH